MDNLDIVLKKVYIIRNKLSKKKFYDLILMSNRCNMCASLLNFEKTLDYKNKKFECSVCCENEYACIDDYLRESDYCNACAKYKCSLMPCRNINCVMYEDCDYLCSHTYDHYAKCGVKLRESIQFLDGCLYHEKNNQKIVQKDKRKKFERKNVHILDTVCY